MKKFLLSIILVLGLLLPSSAQYVGFSLVDLLKPEEANFFRNAFPSIPLDDVIVAFYEIDGVGGVEARVHIYLEEESLIVWVDVADWANVTIRPGICEEEGVRITLFHELTHIEQTIRGKAERQKMYDQCGFYNYVDRPFEREAYTRSWILDSKWPR